VVASVAIAADTYTGVGKNGERVFSDQPIPGGQKVETPSSTNTYKSPTSRATPGAQARPGAERFQYQACAIAQPANDQVFVNPESVSIAVRTVPDLRSGDVVTITVDGKQLSSGQMSARLAPVFRGSHSVTAMVRDTAGNVVCSAPAITFHARQPSVNQGNRARQNTNTPRRP
jgi:hypothetical protein